MTLSKLDVAFKLKFLLENALDTSNGDPEHYIWAEMYHQIFSETISKKIFKEFPDFHYCDPDSSYYEDVSAFINAFVEYAQKQRVTIIASNLSENMLRKYCDGYEISRLKRLSFLRTGDRL